jgi:hypothetical protein
MKQVVISAVSHHTPPHNQITSHPIHHQQSQDTNTDFPVLQTLTQPSGEAANCLSELVSDVLSGLSEDSHS